MKKKIALLFRILFRIISIVIELVFIALIIFWIFWNYNRLSGNITITVNGEEYFLEHLECRYGEEVEKVTYKENSSGVSFKNWGSRYGMYEYSFLISNGDINIEPQIQVFKENWYNIYVVNMDLNVYEDNGIWNAEVTVEARYGTYQETFYDIENNPIEMRVY